MGTLDALLAGIVTEPLEETRWLVLADWLEENDDPRRGELLRLHRRLLATCCGPEEHPERAEWHSRIVSLIDEGVRPCVPQRTITLPGGVPMTFSFIPPGSFLMGSDDPDYGEDVRSVAVTLTRGFFFGRYPVTEAQWRCAAGGPDPNRVRDDHPTANLSWDDCQVFCERLSESAGRRVRLPTEAEWEYACRAGTTTEYYTGDGQAALQKAGWYAGNADGDTHPVGRLAPNAWGLFDLHGNVFERVADWRWAYPAGQATDPVGVAESTAGRVVRGGSAQPIPGGRSDHSARYCRSAARVSDVPSYRRSFQGFRVVLDLPA